MRTVTIAVDTREKRPISFPTYYYRGPDLLKVATVPKALRSGDYRMESDGFDSVGVERKSAPTELYNCFVGSEQSRTEKQLARLASTYQRAYLLIDTQPFELLHWTGAELAGRREFAPGCLVGDVVMQGIVAMAARYSVSVVWAQRADSGPRAMALGRIVLALLTCPVQKCVQVKSLTSAEDVLYCSACGVQLQQKTLDATPCRN